MKKLVSGEVYMLSISVVLSTAVLFLPFIIASNAFQDSWLAVIIGTILAIPFVVLAISLSMRFPEKGLDKILEELFGKYLGKGLSTLYAVFFIYSAALIIRQLEEFIVISLMPETPSLAIRILFIIFLLYGVYEGTLAIVRTNVYIMPVGALVIALVIGLATTQMSYDNLTPVFTIEIEGILKGGFYALAWLMQIPLVILVFFKFIETAKLRKGVKKHGIMVLLLTGVALLVGAVGTIAAFGPRLTADLLYPSFNIARIITIGGFLEHIEVTFVGVWIAAMYMAGAAYCFMAILMLTSVFSVKNTKVLSFPVAFLLVFLPAYLVSDLSNLIQQLSLHFPILTVVFGAIIPTLLFFWTIMLRKGISPQKLDVLQKKLEQELTVDSFGAQDGEIAGDIQGQKYENKVNDNGEEGNKNSGNN